MEPLSHGVYQVEMKPFGKISEQELDQLFSGKAPAVSSGLNDVCLLVRNIQSSYLSDIEPDIETTHLAALMQVVNLTEKGDLAVRPASKVSGPDRQASGLPKRRRRFMLESIFATLSAKIAAGGIAIALASTGGLAATGNLPDQMQTGVAKAVANIGIHIPLGDTAEEALQRAEDAAKKADEALQATEEEVTDAVDGDVAGESKDPNENAAFGQSVATDAQDGGVDGQEISEAARAQAEERKAAGQAHRPEDAGQPEDAGIPADAGQPADPGSQSQTGLDHAGDTPAASHIPTSVPGGNPAGVGGGRP